MRPMSDEMPAVRTDSFALHGGLSLNRSALEAKPGTLIDCLNYEPDVAGGYRLTKGYERFDGRTSPSSATYVTVACTLTSTPAAGTVLTIGAHTCYFVKVVTGGMLVIAIAGTLPGSTAITGTGASGTTDADPLLDYSPTNQEHAQALHECANVLRPAISAVPGQGDVLGVWYFGDSVYAFRNAVGGATAKMHKATVGGWTEVNLGFVIAFTAGLPATFAEGDTINGLTSGATCVVRRLIIRTGTFAAGTAAGIIVTGAVTGNFQAETIRVGATAVATGSGIQTAQTQQPSGAYQFINANFYGGTNTKRMYGCDGVNKAFEFDGSYFVPIATGAAVDTPSAIATNANHLTVGQGASLMHSEPGQPHKWSATFGAGEIAVGDKITGFIALQGAALGVFSRNSIRALLGTSSANWQLQTIAPETGGLARTMQNIGAAYALDDRGIIEVLPTQNYGNFDSNTVSRQIQNIVDNYRDTVIGSCVLRNKNQYRLFTNDGTVIAMKVEQNAAREFGLLRFDHPATCVCSEESSAGEERIFFGTTTGMVYEMERGTSFDGDNILAAMVVWPTTARAPTVHKTYRHAWIEVKTDLFSEIELSPQFDYDAGDSLPALTADYDFLFQARGAGGRWESSYFESFFWDSPYVERVKLDINGSGVAIAFVILSDSAIDAGHNVRSISYTYTPRRQMR